MKCDATHTSCPRSVTMRKGPVLPLMSRVALGESHIRETQSVCDDNYISAP